MSDPTLHTDRPRLKQFGMDHVLQRIVDTIDLGRVAVIHNGCAELPAVLRCIQERGSEAHLVVRDGPDGLHALTREAGIFSTIVIAVDDPRVYHLRRAVLAAVHATGAPTPQIIATAFPYHPLDEDTVFSRIVDALAAKTPWGRDFWRNWRFYGEYQLLRTALRLPGICVEFGACYGFAACFTAETIAALGVPSKPVLLFDTWRGMPDSDPGCDNHYRAGDFGDSSRAQVEQILAPWPGVFTLVEGDIRETIAALPKEPICYCRVDVDLYAPTRAILAHAYDRVLEGGIIYFDDYVLHRTVGERIAVDEFLEEHPERLCYALGDRAYLAKGLL